MLADPAVESMAGFIGGGRGINNAQTFVRLKPLAERKVSAQVVAERIRNGLPKVPGGRLWLNVEQDIRFGGRMGGRSRSYDYTLLADDSSQLKAWAERVQGGARGAAGADRHSTTSSCRASRSCWRSIAASRGSWASTWPT